MLPNIYVLLPSYVEYVIDTNCLLFIPLLWSRLGRNRYETKRIYTFFLLLYSLSVKVLFKKSIYVLNKINPVYQESVRCMTLKVKMLMNLPKNYSKLWSLTLQLNVCFVRVPSLPIWWRHLNFIPICCAIMLFRFQAPIK